MSTTKAEWHAALAQQDHDHHCNRLYKDQNRLKALSDNYQVIEWAVIRKAAIRMSKTCSLARMTAESFVRRLTKTLRVTAYEIGRICEARLFRLYLQLFYFKVEREHYYHQREFSSYYHAPLSRCLRYCRLFVTRDRKGTIMSMTVQVELKGLKEDPAKLARSPRVLEEICKHLGWQYAKDGAYVRMNVRSNQAGAGAYISFDSRTSQFTFDKNIDPRTGVEKYGKDYTSVWKESLKNVQRADGSLSDMYIVVDVAVAAQEKHGCDWTWVGDSVSIEDAVIKEKLAFS